MKLARYSLNGTVRVGVVDGDRVLDLADLDPAAPSRISDVLAKGPAYLAHISPRVKQAAASHALATVRLLAPVPEASKYLCTGLNYADHLAEARALGMQIPEPLTQGWFAKQVSSINGPYDPVYKPKVTSKMDYEAELGFVISKRVRYATEEQALTAIGGYFVANDFSARDWQFASPTVFLGKSFDTHGPIGPWIVTPDEIGNPRELGIRCFVNGELRQQGNTSQMIFGFAEQIMHLSQVMTLMPGDLISTGTCAGVGIATGRFLKVGDIVRVEIDRIGHIENEVIAEPAFDNDPA
jgi:2-keto-4-pentenoate hydratase/2-oxohepta-3-ene-1,7-dioic acid hydratase in catechol pathway